jgi:hypothetical protein
MCNLFIKCLRWPYIAAIVIVLLARVFWSEWKFFTQKCHESRKPDRNQIRDL